MSERFVQIDLFDPQKIEIVVVSGKQLLQHVIRVETCDFNALQQDNWVINQTGSVLSSLHQIKSTDAAACRYVSATLLQKCTEKVSASGITRQPRIQAAFANRQCVIGLHFSVANPPTAETFLSGHASDLRELRSSHSKKNNQGRRKAKKSPAVFKDLDMFLQGPVQKSLSCL